MERFIDDIAVEVVEAKLISPLGNIFSPIAVSTMPAALVTAIAGESEESRELRTQLVKQLNVLTKGSDTCRRFVIAPPFGTNARRPPVPPPFSLC
jgi:hypothetical protein